MKNPTSTDQKIYDLLWKELSSAYCLTVEEKRDNLQPTCRTLAGTDLYYDEGNEEIRTADGKFWSEIPDEQARRILAAFLAECLDIKDEYNLVEPWGDDELPVDIFKKMLEKKSIYPLTEADVYSDTLREASISATKECFENAGFDTDDQNEMFQERIYDELWDEVRCTIEERNKSPEKKLFLQSRIHGFVQLGSNYDCWIDIWDAGGLWYEESAMQGILAVLSLNPRKIKEEALKQGIAAKGRWPNYPGREGKEVVKYDTFVKSLRECPNYGNWSFFGTFDMQALWDAGMDADKLTIPSGTDCGMFNNWNGGGTLFFCKTIREISLKEIEHRQKPYSDTYHVRIDEGNKQDYGYPPSSVYGTHPSDDCFLI